MGGWACLAARASRGVKAEPAAGGERRGREKKKTAGEVRDDVVTEGGRAGRGKKALDASACLDDVVG